MWKHTPAEVMVFRSWYSFWHKSGLLPYQEYSEMGQFYIFCSADTSVEVAQLTRQIK